MTPAYRAPQSERLSLTDIHIERIGSKARARLAGQHASYPLVTAQRVFFQREVSTDLVVWLVGRSCADEGDAACRS